MSRWNIQELGKVSSIHNGSTPSTSVEEFWNGNIIWITPKDLSEQNRKYIEKGERFITKKGLSKVKSKLLPKGTLLLSSRAPIGLLSIAKNELVTNQGFKNIIVDENQISNEFLYYYLKLKVKELNNLGTGTTFKELSKSSLEKFKVKLPDLPTQQKIASVLSDLDDKIELNNRINAELEAMAKTLYDYWFVQFDFPVASTGSATTTGSATEISGENVASTPLSQQSDEKNPAAERSQQSVAERSSKSVAERSRGYKSSGGKMVYNETLKREIPEGWEVKTIGDYCKSSGGFAFKSSWWTDNGTPVVKIKDIQEDYTINLSDLAFVDISDKNIDDKFKAKPGDVLIAMTGATVGKYAIVPYTEKPLYVNQRVGYFNLGIKPEKKLPFLINSLNQKYFRESVFTLASGAAQPNISNEQINNIQLLLPSKEIIELYNKVFEPYYSKILLNQKQNQELSALRDWLLPMLMNGQVKVG